MSNANTPVTLEILDKEYRIACPQGEEDTLRASAHFLNRRIKEIRESGKAIGADRIAVMTALNLAHEYLTKEEQQQQNAAKLSSRYKALQERIDTAIRAAQQLEF